MIFNQTIEVVKLIIFLDFLFIFLFEICLNILSLEASFSPDERSVSILHISYLKLTRCENCIVKTDG